MPTEYCFLAVDHWSTCMSKAEWSGWMQAIFSVAAICAAIGIAWWQRRSEHRHEAERQLAAAFVAATAVMTRVAPLVGAAASYDTFTADLNVENAKDRITRANSAFSTLLLPSEEQLLHLTPVLPNVAAGLAMGVGLFQRAAYIVSLQVANLGNLSLACSQVHDMRGEAEQAAEILRAAFDELQGFVAKVGPELMGDIAEVADPESSP